MTASEKHTVHFKFSYAYYSVLFTVCNAQAYKRADVSTQMIYLCLLTIRMGWLTYQWHWNIIL